MAKGRYFSLSLFQTWLLSAFSSMFLVAAQEQIFSLSQIEVLQEMVRLALILI